MKTLLLAFTIVSSVVSATDIEIKIKPTDSRIDQIMWDDERDEKVLIPHSKPLPELTRFVGLNMDLEWAANSTFTINNR